MRERSEGSLASLRRLNRRRVINALREHGMVSRAEIARRTGLSRSTVSSRVAVSDLSSNILAERAAPMDIDHASHEGLDVAIELIDEALAEAGVERERVIGAGLGLPGPIDHTDGVIGSSAILPGWVG